MGNNLYLHVYSQRHSVIKKGVGDTNNSVTLGSIEDRAGWLGYWNRREIFHFIFCGY